MIKKISFYAFLFFLTTYLSAQTPAKYWIQFTDKNNSEYSIENPDRYLSERAIEKRKMFNIPITETDLPVNQLYINNILNLDTGIVLFTKSKWFNAITVYTEDSLFSEKIQKLPFVKDWERTISMKETEHFVHKDSIYIYKIDRGEVEKKSLPRELNYGETNRQIRLNNVHWLHRMGFYGENIVLMVMDAGFHNVDTLKYFQNLRDEQRLLGVRNFVQLGVNPFKKMSHGTMVLSCIVGYMPDKYVGTAPKVSVYLAKTEDERSENKIEEDNWVAGIEWADSLGVDIVNSSLGYTKFDDSTATRKYEDLTGRVSRASIAADIAIEKGLIICNSAGNEGNKKWYYIGSPADAHNVISVGATNNKGKIAPFSSHGPTADGRVKPDACATGWNTEVVHPRGRVIPSNGTSFASPMLAGMVACLREAFPEKSNFEIIQAVRLSGSKAEYPDRDMGYGITDFLKAYNYLKYNYIDLNEANHQFIPRIKNFVVNEQTLELKINSNFKQTIYFQIEFQKSKKVLKKKIPVKMGINDIKIKLPKTKLAYDFINLKIFRDDDKFEFLLGIEK